MKQFHITLLVALGISGVAAYFSVVGLIALFAAAVIPVAIMGSILEVGKITTVAWLHANWVESPKILRAYLISAVVVLMTITSLGIYGFLSKGHLEQTLPVVGIERQIAQNNISMQNNNVQIESLQGQIQSIKEKNDEIILNAKVNTENQNTAEVNRLAATKIPFDIQIDAQRNIIHRYEVRLQSLDDTIASYNAANAITRGRQALAEQKNDRDEIAAGIADAEAEILKFEIEKSKIDQVIFSLGATPSNSEPPQLIPSNNINDLISQLSKTNTQLSIDNTTLQLQIDTTTAKLGPVKYVAELFGIEDSGVAVRWVIVLIMFAFDPVAIALLIAAQWSWVNSKPKSTLQDNGVLEKLKNKNSEHLNNIQLLRDANTKFTNQINAATKEKNKMETVVMQLTKEKNKLESSLNDCAKSAEDHVNEVQQLKQTISELQVEDENIAFIINQLKNDNRLAIRFKKIIEQAAIDEKSAWISTPKDKK